MNVETGSIYRATLADVRGTDGLPATPSTLTCTITLPDQTTSLPTVVQDSAPPAVSSFHADYLTTKPGLHNETWAGTVPNITKSDQFNVITWRSILSLSDARDYLDLRDTSRDEVLRAQLYGITRLIERHIGTCVQRVITDEWIPGDVRTSLRLAHAPLPSATSVTSVASVYPQGPAWAAADLIVNPAAGTVRAVSLLPFWFGPWKATYTAGRAEIPGDIIEGAKAALYDLWATQRGVSADQLEPTLDEVSAYETAVPPGWRLPPRVMQLLDGEAMPGFA